MAAHGEQSNWIDGKWIDPNPCQWWIDPPRCYTPAPAPGVNRRVVQYGEPPEESDEEYTLRLMVEAAKKAQAGMVAEAEQKQRQEEVLSINRRAIAITRYFDPPTDPMPPEVKTELETREILRKAMSSERRKEDRERLKQQVAMNVKMAKVRAAKRKKR